MSTSTQKIARQALEAGPRMWSAWAHGRGLPAAHQQLGPLQGFLGVRGVSSDEVGYGRSKPHASEKQPAPPKFGGSVLSASDSSGAKQPPYSTPTPKRKVTIVSQPTPAAARGSLNAKDLTATALRELGVGGLDTQLEELFRRVFASRLVPAGIAAETGMGHAKGLLLYGPPGTGKTLIARKIGRLLSQDREPEVVNGPELLHRFVGQSEANIRALFEKAEGDYRRRGDDADLHVVIFDEIDALCKARGSGSGAGSGHSGVGDSVVNQLLTKLDGIDSTPNLLVIGLTNRKDLLDEALLRPGRFEVQVEVGLPDAQGRHQILEIHTKMLSESGRLSDCVDLRALAEVTRNFSGAELSGLVRSATSRAYSRLLQPILDSGKSGSNTVPEIDGKSMIVSHDDLLSSLSEVTPALGAAGPFGAGAKAFKRWMPNGILQTGATLSGIIHASRGLIAQVKGGGPDDAMVTALLEGPVGTGKTALAAALALESDFPFARILCPADSMVGMTDAERSAALKKAFADASASPLSVLVLDNLERILGYSRVGPVYSNEVLQTLLLLLRRQPRPDHRLLVLATTSAQDVMQDLEVSSAFDVRLHVPPLELTEEKASVFQAVARMSAEEASAAATLFPGPFPIKRLLKTIKLAAAAEHYTDIVGAPADGRWPIIPEMRVTLSGVSSYLETMQPGVTDDGSDSATVTSSQ